MARDRRYTQRAGCAPVQLADLGQPQIQHASVGRRRVSVRERSAAVSGL